MGFGFSFSVGAAPYVHASDSDCVLWLQSAGRRGSLGPTYRDFRAESAGVPARARGEAESGDDGYKQPDGLRQHSILS